MIQPFDFSGVKMFRKFDELTGEFDRENEAEDIVKIYEPLKQLPIYKEEYKISSGLFGNFFFIEVKFHYIIKKKK